MQLKTLQIPTGAVFAPMAGLTDAACRHLMADHGAAWTVSEMASAKALCFGDRKSFALLKDPAPHGLYAIQLFGAEPETLAKAILLVREKGIRFDMLDINMGCPAPKITSSGAGSRLLLDPPLCGAMVAAARKALGDDTPLTVKMRIGWDGEHRTGVEVARQCAGNGADLLAVHGRTREQMYIPPIDAGAIAAIKQAVDIPVLANGDVTSAAGALALLQETGCDGVMIGRAALGDPWLFERVRAALLGEQPPAAPTGPGGAAAFAHSEPAAGQLVEVLRVARQHMLDEIFGLGAAQRVQGGQLLFARGLKLAVAALALLNALDDGRKPVRRFQHPALGVVEHAAR